MMFNTAKKLLHIFFHRLKEIEIEMNKIKVINVANK